jgi:hypothetical protein
MPKKYDALRVKDEYEEPPKMREVRPRNLGKVNLPRRKIPPRAQAMRYNRKTDEWDGTLEDGRHVHVKNVVYQKFYHDTLADKKIDQTRRGDLLRGMTRSPFWGSQAETFERENQFISPDLYITGEQ